MPKNLTRSVDVRKEPSISMVHENGSILLRVKIIRDDLLGEMSRSKVRRNLEMLEGDKERS